MTRHDEAQTVFLGTLLALCSSAPFYVVPDYLAALQRGGGFSLAQLGYLSGGESLMIALACVATGIAIHRIRWQLMLVAALVCVVGDLVSVFATHFESALVVRALTGVFGEGPLYAMSYAVLGSTRNPDRAFGIGIGSVGLGASAVFAAESWLSGPFGVAAVLAPYAAVALVLCVVVGVTKRTLRTGNHARSAGPSVAFRAGAILVSIVVWSAAAGAFWAFCTTAAPVLGVAEATVSRALSIALLAGMVGIVTPILIGNRFGRIAPLVLATAGLVLSCFLFFSSRGLLGAALALSLLQCSWDISAVYQLAGVATVDRSGRYGAFGAVAQITGSALGPALAGGPLGRFGYGMMPFAVAVVALAALVLFVVGARPFSRSARA